MNRHSRIALIVLALIACGCAVLVFVQIKLTTIDVHERPIHFLKSLKRIDQNGANKTIWICVGNWITKSDLSDLSSRLASEVACTLVVSPRSSNYGIDEVSTEGEQAFYLIWGFQSNNYPPPPGVFPANLDQATEIRDLLDREKIVHPSFETWAVVKRAKQRSLKQIN